MTNGQELLKINVNYPHMYTEHQNQQILKKKKQSAVP